MDFSRLYKYAKDLSVLYVEDDDVLRGEIHEVLEEFFLHIDVAVDGLDALEKYEQYFSKKQIHYDLIITDLNMPKMDGDTFITKVHEIHEEQPVIVISAYNDSSRLMNMIQNGISNFILKPTVPAQLIDMLYKTCKNIAYKKLVDKHYLEVEDENITQALHISSQEEEILYTQQLSMETIANLVENYDDETGTHVKRIQSYTLLMLEHLDVMNKDTIALASILHDIGKLLVPKDILSKPGKLDCVEIEIMQKHAKLGGEVLLEANQKFYKKFNKDSYLKIASDIAMYHHEKYNGLGYPDALKGNEIPLSARVVAIADVYDALRSKRVYKKGFSHEVSVNIIKEESAKSFDPMLVDIFLKIHKEYEKVFNCYE